MIGARSSMRLALLVGGLVHLLPLIGLLGRDQLQRLYGLAIEQPEVVMLFQHRALLFGLIGGLMLSAVWRRELQLAAGLIGVFSALGFLLLAGNPQQLGAALQRVWLADLLVVGLLVPSSLWRATFEVRVADQFGLTGRPDAE